MTGTDRAEQAVLAKFREYLMAHRRKIPGKMIDKVLILDLFIAGRLEGRRVMRADVVREVCKRSSGASVDRVSKAYYDFKVMADRWSSYQVTGAMVQIDTRRGALEVFPHRVLEETVAFVHRSRHELQGLHGCLLDLKHGELDRLIASVNSAMAALDLRIARLTRV